MVLFGICTCLGIALQGRSGARGVNFLVGYGAVSFAVIAVGILPVAVPLSMAATIVLLMAIALAVVTRVHLSELSILGRCLLIALPLLVWATSIPPFFWDDFTTWIPNAAYLYRHDSFPRSGQPTIVTGWPAYPYAMPMWTWLVSLACGRFVENAGNAASALFLVAAAALLVEAVRQQVRQATLPAWWLWGAAAVAILCVTALSPSFKKGHSLSGSADTATSVAIAALAWLGYRILEDPLPVRRLLHTWSVLLQFSLISLLLVSLKQPNVVLLGVLWAGVCAAGLRDPRRGNLLRIVLIGCASVPAIVFSVLWRQFTDVHIPGGQPDWLPFGQWRWSMAHIIAGGLIITMLKAPAHFILMFGVVARTLKVLRRRPRVAADGLLIITTVTFVGYTLFLFMVWVATNFPVETAGAGFPRYSAHLGVLGVLTLAVDFAIPARKHFDAWPNEIKGNRGRRQSPGCRIAPGHVAFTFQDFRIRPNYTAVRQSVGCCTPKRIHRWVDSAW